MIEDDRFELNNAPENKPIIGSFVMRLLIFTILLVVGITAYALLSNSKVQPAASEVKGSDAAAYLRVKEPVKPVQSEADIKKEYIKSTRHVGNKKDPIYIREFLKNPDKFKGDRLNFVAKIMAIEESKGETFIQAFINRDFDVVNIHYPEAISVYKDDFITVYGEGAGVMTGKNRMGAEMSWPLVKAKYIVKKKMPNDDE